MTSLSKAFLQEISADRSAKPVEGTLIAVQFNPQSLKLALANKVEGGDSKARQKRQYLGKTSTTLSFDLVFDTADLDDGGKPVSVRTRTAMVERFVLPKGQGNAKQAPPKCRFSWDQLVIDGIVEELSIDFELFAANGTPLRARMSVSIKEQDAKYELLQSGSGANTGSAATPPGQTGTGPGSAATGPTDRSAQALAGESAADFAARHGLDPAAWRGIAAQLGGGSPLALSAGAAIDFNASLSAGAGLGLAAGLEVGAGVSVQAAFGLEASAGLGVSVGLDASLQAGFALSAAGGLGAAIESVAIVRTEAAAAHARQAFGAAVPGGTAAAAQGRAGLPPPAGTPRPTGAEQARAPLQRTGLPLPTHRAAAPPAPPPPLADARATSFGLGVPLRPRTGRAADLRADAAAGRIPLHPHTATAVVLGGTDPAAPPWTRLPAGAARTAADRAQERRTPHRLCNCACSRCR